MLRTDKEQVVAELTERLRTSTTLIVADFRGLRMKDLDALRGQLLAHGAKFSVVKNTLARRAAEAADAQAVLALLEGPSAIAFLDANGDPVAVAKALAETARTTRILTIRGGVLDGKVVSEDDVKNLATLPPTDVLRAMLLGAIAGPMTTVVGIFAAPLRDIVGVIEARIAQLEEQGGQAAVAETAVEETEESTDEQAGAEPAAQAAEPETGGEGEES